MASLKDVSQCLRRCDWAATIEKDAYKTVPVQKIAFRTKLRSQNFYQANPAYSYTVQGRGNTGDSLRGGLPGAGTQQTRAQTTHAELDILTRAGFQRNLKKMQFRTSTGIRIFGTPMEFM